MKTRGGCCSTASCSGIHLLSTFPENEKEDNAKYVTLYPVTYIYTHTHIRV